MRDITRELSSSEAFLSQLLAISRVTALNEMASGVAHELNQPLAAIATFSHAGERMLNRPDPMVARALDVFRQISQEALGAGECLQRIRRLFEQQRRAQGRCQMSDLIAEVRPVLNSLAAQVDAALRIDAPSVLPDVHVDRLEIQQVLLALVKNAADASALISGERPILIDVSAERYAVEVGVADRGAGVRADVQERMFHPFFTTKPQGTGLGLASSRAIVESHDGTIGFHNLPAGGVRFWFRLPVAQDPAQLS